METKPCNKAIVYVIFGVSGFCALIYEILWTKHLSLTFGTGILAVSTVAATFMGGLALGSYLFGKYADHERNLLSVYAMMELGIAITALLFLPTLAIVERVYALLSQSFPAHPFISTTFHFTFSALLLLPPTIFMGGTFPLMCRFFARKKCGGQIGRLYALNTLGATFGAFAAGFILIPLLGLSQTANLAILLNLAIAVTSYILSRQIGTTEPVDISKVKRPELPKLITNHRMVLFSIALVGFFSLAYEILWTRVLLLFLGNTSYAFSLMLSAYLVGIAAGGAIYARKVHPELNEKKVFSVLASLMGLSVIITVPLYDQLAYAFQFAHMASGERWWHLSLISFLIVFGVMVIPTILSGSLLPAAVAILDPGKVRTGEGVGLVVLYNTAGAVFGSLVAGFILIPSFGILGSFRLLAGGNLLLALILCWKFGQKNSIPRAVTFATVIGILLCLAPISWDPGLMNSGIYVYAPKYAEMGGIDKVLSMEKVIDVIEGIDTTVAVHETNDGENRFFTVNGKTDGGTGRDMSTQILVGHLPLLLHPSPREVLVIGLGTGITLRGLSAHPVESIDCAEISPGVVEASSYFKEANDDALNDSKVNLHVTDGRNLLLTSSKTYDVIISEPSNPWQSGNANLFTSDFYKLALSNLKPYGLFCQWIGLYDITPQNLKIACNTFLDIFPKALVFKSGSDLILVGGQTPLNFDYQLLSSRMSIPTIRDTFKLISIDSPGDLLAKYYLYAEDPLKYFSKGAGYNTDDNPVLEYSARYNLGEHTLGEFQMTNTKNLTEIEGKIFLPVVNMGISGDDVAAALRDLGKGYNRAGRIREAENFMRKAVEFETKNINMSEMPEEG